jgi:hypothetical protein
MTSRLELSLQLSFSENTNLHKYLYGFQDVTLQMFSKPFLGGWVLHIRIRAGSGHIRGVKAMPTQ